MQREGEPTHTTCCSGRADHAPAAAADLQGRVDLAREAEYDWQCTLTDTILKMGWNKCEGVPAMYTFPQAKTELPAAMITVVDDFLIAGKGTEIG